MAFVWSFGIKFNGIEDAEKVKSQIDNIILSDGTEIGIYKHITYENGNLNLTECTLELILHNMQVSGNQKLLSFPYFYEIRDFFYQFLRNLDIDFCEALFEFEGSDRIAHENLIEYINQYGIGEIVNSDNFADLKVSSTIYQSKRILDGLVLSKENFEKLKNEYSEYFEPFKNGYYWLAIKNSR
ncbi:hypothetical protein [Flavobacterium sp.]|uniref:hypothetical protein n=1 Tax=Flavobacterium sp. TaxID=239 RepID=UPI003F698004